MKYNFDEIIDRRGTGSVKWDVREGVLPMFVADMDFRAAPQIVEAVQQKLKTGVWGYDQDLSFPEIITAWFQREYAVTIKPDWIILLPAIVPALAALSLLREGRVLVNTPNYHFLLDAPGKAGKETIRSPLKNTGEYYEMDFEDMRRRIEPDVRLFYLSNPQNPVGRVFKQEELLELNRFARERDLIVISDEVHCGLVYDHPHVPYFSVDEYAADHSITIMGPGKTFNLAGLPFGFAVVPNKKLRQDFQHTCFALPDPGIVELTAAKAAYSEAGEWKDQLITYLRGNRDFLEQRLRAAFPRIGMTHVEGTYLQWLDFRPCGLDHPFGWFLKYPKILMNNGSQFGLDGYVRMNFGTPRANLEEAIRRIETHLKG